LRLMVLHVCCGLTVVRIQLLRADSAPPRKIQFLFLSQILRHFITTSASGNRFVRVTGILTQLPFGKSLCILRPL